MSDREDEPVLGSGRGDVEQAALLLDGERGGVLDCVAGGQSALLASEHEDRLCLGALGAVDRRDRQPQILLGGQRVEVVDAGLLEKAGERRVLAVLALVGVCCATQLAQVPEDARNRAAHLIGRSLLEDCPQTGEIAPVIVVSDNGSCYRAGGFARHIDQRPELAHVRTRHKAPETNGVIERFFQSAKYEHLYRHEITDGPALADHVEDFLTAYNEVRPHEALDFKLPIDRYVKPPPITLAPAIQVGPCS